MKTNHSLCVHGHPSTSHDDQWPARFELPGICESKLCVGGSAVYEFVYVLARVFWACGFTTFKLLHNFSSAPPEIRFATGFAGLEMVQSISRDLIHLHREPAQYALARSLADTARAAFVQGCWKNMFIDGCLSPEAMKERVEHLVASAFAGNVATMEAMAKKLDKVGRERDALRSDVEDLRAELESMRMQRKPSAN